MSNAGRPTKQREVVVQAILETLRKGNTRQASALSAGISYGTMARWCQEDDEFRESVENAEAEAEILHVQNIQLAGIKEWTASAWWLERRRHGQWRKPADRTELTGKDGSPIQTENVALDDSTRAARLAELLQSATKPDTAD